MSNFTAEQIEMMNRVREEIASEEQAPQNFLGVPFQAEFEDLPREEKTNRPIFPNAVSPNNLQALAEAFRTHNDNINTVEGYTGTGFSVVPKQAAEGRTYVWSDAHNGIIERTFQTDAEGTLNTFESPVRGAIRVENDELGAQYFWDSEIQRVIASAFGAEDEDGFIQTIVDAGIQVVR